MGASTEISWTDATWNPLRGCSRVSDGCTNCYAESVAARFSGPGQPYEGLATTVNGHPRWTNTVRLVPEHLQDPLRWRKSRRVFVNSMSDLFHEQVPEAALWDILGVIWAAQRHTFQALTKRAARMQEMMARWYARPDCMSPLIRNLWLGVSAEHQSAANERIPELLYTRAAVHWVSAESLLGPIDLRSIFPDGYPPAAALDWLVIGGESGANHRPMDLHWLESLVQQCRDAQIAVWVKQDSGRLPGKQGRIPDELWIHEFPAAVPHA